ncbi:FAD-dependent oxidoreductase [Streptomyces otsuchiensis]|uniref:FAD-dependent oxidoreductase n=1 Tax=Streptomyces otsuchiensis TaxID=2681388 RepID=UPI00103017E4|nr:FAD-dependent oxidoreductase [Streptomyces otsuchiensis]
MVVIGGDAAGMSAAAQARRLSSADELDIVAFERGAFTSYSACGIPYWVAGDVGDREQLIARDPDEHRRRGIDVRTHTEITRIDTDGRRVLARARDGREEWHGYDDLVIATGAVPLRPPLPGIDAEGVHGVQNLTDGAALIDALDRLGAPAPAPGDGDSCPVGDARAPGDTRTADDARTAGRRGGGPLRAVVVGAGYIGIEMAEAMIRRGFTVTVVDQAAEPMTTLDPDMGALVREAMNGMGIETVMGDPVTEIETGDDGAVRAVRTENGRHPADLVVLGLGTRPQTELAEAAGLPLGPSGGLLTDRAMRVRGHRHVWAGGDCVEVEHRLTGDTRHIPLGTHANKHGQVIGANIAGDYATFPGVVGTAVSKVCDLEIARTGLLEREATAAGLQFVTVTVEATSRAGYYPGAEPMRVKLLAERITGRLLGAQIVGREVAAKRVDTVAVALTAGMTAADLTMLDLGYAPPFSPVWDPVQVAARKAAAAVRAEG